jgi:hypothetical protein
MTYLPNKTSTTNQKNQELTFLPWEIKHYGKTQEEQIKINQQNLQIFAQWRKEAETLTLEEKQEYEADFESFKQIIDVNRSRKLYS